MPRTAYLTPEEKRERASLSQKAYRARNKEKIREQKKKQRETLQYKISRKLYLDNPETKEKIRQRFKQYLSNPDVRARRHAQQKTYFSRPEVKLQKSLYHKEWRRLRKDKKNQEKLNNKTEIESEILDNSLNCGNSDNFENSEKFKQNTLTTCILVTFTWVKPAKKNQLKMTFFGVFL